MTELRLPLPVLMLVTDREVAGGEDALVRKVSEAVDGGVNVVQVRDKDLDDEARLLMTHRIMEAIGGRALVFINGSVDIAREVSADGVHLPGYVPPLAHRPSGLMVGRSVHSVASARRALREGVDYLIAGSVYETSSHEGRVPAGLALVADILSVASTPVVAIGGITVDRVAEVIDAGASGVAVISAILAAPSPSKAAAALSDALVRRWLRDRALA